MKEKKTPPPLMRFAARDADTQALLLVGVARGMGHIRSMLNAYLRDYHGFPSLSVAEEAANDYMEHTCVDFTPLPDTAIQKPYVKFEGAWRSRLCKPPVHLWRVYHQRGGKHVATVYSSTGRRALRYAQHALYHPTDPISAWPVGTAPIDGLMARDEGRTKDAVDGHVVWALPWGSKGSWGDAQKMAEHLTAPCKWDFRRVEERVLASGCVSIANYAGLPAIPVEPGTDLHGLRSIVEDIPREEAKRRNYRDAYTPMPSGPAPLYKDDPNYKAVAAKWEDGKGWVNLYRRDTGTAGAGGIYASKADAQYIADQYGNGGRNVPVLITWKPYAEAKPQPAVDELAKAYGTGRLHDYQKKAIEYLRPPVAWSQLNRSTRDYYVRQLKSNLHRFDSEFGGDLFITCCTENTDCVVISTGGSGSSWQEKRDILRRWLSHLHIYWDVPSDRRSCTRVSWPLLRRALRVGTA